MISKHFDSGSVRRTMRKSSEAETTDGSRTTQVKKIYSLRKNNKSNTESKTKKNLIDRNNVDGMHETEST